MGYTFILAFEVEHGYKHDFNRLAIAAEGGLPEQTTPNQRETLESQRGEADFDSSSSDDVQHLSKKAHRNGRRQIHSKAHRGSTNA